MLNLKTQVFRKKIQIISYGVSTTKQTVQITYSDFPTVLLRTVKVIKKHVHLLFPD